MKINKTKRHSEMDLNDAVHALATRIPELEWRLSKLPYIARAKLPRGLFQHDTHLTWIDSRRCIESLRHDLEALQANPDDFAAHFIAQQLSRKVNVLLRICHESSFKEARLPVFSMQRMSTRQQWLVQLQQDITRLTAQQAALLEALSTHEARLMSVDATLLLQHELGEVTRRLTEAQEKLARD
jgi:hypothetical protein